MSLPYVPYVRFEIFKFEELEREPLAENVPNRQIQISFRKHFCLSVNTYFLLPLLSRLSSNKSNKQLLITKKRNKEICEHPREIHKKFNQVLCRFFLHVGNQQQAVMILFRGFELFVTSKKTLNEYKSIDISA